MTVVELRVKLPGGPEGRGEMIAMHLEDVLRRYGWADYEMGRIMQNILDPNTKPTEKRKLTITIEFTPDDDRAMIGISVTAKSALAATTAIKTAIYASVGSFGEFSAVEMTPQVPGQTSFDGTEQEAAPVLRIAK